MSVDSELLNLAKELVAISNELDQNEYKYAELCQLIAELEQVIAGGIQSVTLDMADKIINRITKQIDTIIKLKDDDQPIENGIVLTLQDKITNMKTIVKNLG